VTVPGRIKRAGDLGWRLGRILALGLFVSWALGPLAWQGITSIKSEQELVRLPPLLPETPTATHYRTVTARSGLGREILNSIIVATSATVSAIAVAALCAFALARLPIAGKTTILSLLLGISMFPPVAVISPLYLLVRWLGLRDTLAALILTHTAYALPLAIWVLTVFFRQIPVELYWAARVDGCGPWRALWSVLIPPARPGLAAAALLAFIFSWNEFMFALTLTATDRSRTAPVAIALFPSLHEVPWGDMAAATLVVTAPVIALALAFQRHLLAGLTAGSIKG